ncbi:MAG: ABC transporter permease [Proteobacteria bacterium]|nr:MAG: ABC transporter permease [Pseudomonadota bacterium]
MTPTRRHRAIRRGLTSSRRALAQSLLQFRSNPLRTVLTLLGIVFGVASVVAMLAIGEGAQREILATIEQMGADVVHLKATPVAKAKLGAVVNKSRGLGLADLEDIRQVLPGLAAIAYRARVELGATDLRNVDATTLPVLGVGPGYLQLHKLRLSAGRGLLPLDHRDARRVAVIGDGLARRAFPEGDAIGKRVRLDYAYFEVVGVLDTGGQKGVKDLPVDPTVHEAAVLIPFAAATEQLRGDVPYAQLELLSLKVANTEATLAAKRVLEPLIERLHGGYDDVEIVAPEELLRQKEATQAVLNTVLLSIAAISLLVGGIGVMNIMLANIMERIPEIGLRRAIGARRADIRNQFLLEAVLICTGGGLIGVISGFGISLGVGLFSSMPIAFPWYAALLSLGISALVGVTFGMMPALRAANTNPIEALQHG